MNDEQIEKQLQLIENKYPGNFKQFKLKDHIFWSPVADTDRLSWGIHAAFLGNLPAKIRVEVSSIMNKLTKGGYTAKKTVA